MNQKPPIDIEQALDLVLAMPAHRSENEHHAAFGHLLLEEYFLKLRERYINDDQATGYLENLLACVASAVRAFSVERDIFGTRWQSMLDQRKHEIDRADRLDRFSPFRENGVWGKLFALIGGGSGGALIAEFVKGISSNSNVLLMASILIGSVLGLFVFDFALDTIRNHMLKRTEAKLPVDLIKSWRTETISRYRKILRQFLLSAIKIREEWYPELSTLNGSTVFNTYRVPHIDFPCEPCNSHRTESADLLEVELDKIIDRHMAFG